MSESNIQTGSAENKPPLDNHAEEFPLSLMQESLWVQEQLAPGTAAYNLPDAWRMNGRLVLEALQQALDAMARRHETLRTIFRTRGGVPTQLLLPSQPFSLRLSDLSQCADPENEAARWLAVEARRPFDLANGPLARMAVFRLGERDHILLLTMHHIVSDETSLAVFQRELAQIYGALLKGTKPALPELPLQYADFSVWQRGALAAGTLEPQLQYWRQKLQPPLPVLALPVDHSRPGRRSFRGATQFFRLAPQLTQGLKEFSRQQGVTLFMTLLAAFQTLLHRWTRQTDLLVGSPMAGRTRVETENLIGFLVNIHALRTDLSGDPTFLELLARVRETVLGAFANQEVSIDQVVAAVQPERAPGAHPLYQVVFGLQPSAEGWQLPGLSAHRLELDNGCSKFDCTFLLTETSDGLQARCEYSTDLFEAATIARLANQFELLCEGVVRRPDQRLSKLPLVSGTERQQLLSRWAASAPAAPAETICVHHLFEQQAQRKPEAIALSLGAQALSYGELNVRANRLARHLRRLGVGPESYVALCFDCTPDLVVALLAVLKAGGAYVPLAPDSPSERLAFVLADTQATLLLTAARSRPAAVPAGCRVVCLDSEPEPFAGEPEENLACASTGENTAYVIYTSGSTGRPKGVMVTHRNVVRLLRQTEPWFAFGPADVWTLFHSYTFDFSVWEIWGALAYGGRLVLVPYLVSRAPAEFYRLLAAEKVTVLNQTPSAFRQLIWAESVASRPLELSLRFVICGGEALDLQSLKPWFDRHGDERPQVVNMYGITETTVHVTYRVIRSSDLRAGLGSVFGVPLPDLSIYLLDQHLEPVPVQVPGEIFVGGAGVARGYINRPELTEQRFIPDPFSAVPGARLYRSGDLARLNSRGELEYLGRLDDQLKIRGFRVEPGEIESALNAHPAVRESVVVAYEPQPGDQRLAAYFVAKGEAPAPEQLRRHLEERLPAHMLPAAFVPLPALPLTSNGKLARRALPPPDFKTSLGVGVTVAPRNDSEKTIAAIWRQVLDRPSLGVEDNFFHLGGHSLLATQVMSRLAAALQRDLPVSLLFEAPTIAKLAEAVTRAAAEGPAPAWNIPKRASQPAAPPLLADLEQLTEAELDALLEEPEVRKRSA